MNNEAKDLVRSMFEGSYQGMTKPSQLGPIKHQKWLYGGPIPGMKTNKYMKYLPSSVIQAMTPSTPNSLVSHAMMKSNRGTKAYF